ncbi:related to UDP-N-acetyl-D-mannosamine 6-dehydrogenase [Ramularia collo-cygni]|uniref:Related to UDP-N-acetyl-D-mannosamine 6-dehydrogenase n=1 Tax=Ramularia collo-cygni TaxID=112498 RepID=A0A2D3UQW8_9PEZI|nr:related to UDP-N-acetyl-D-mannosamine 6-dehydrogenase [Ramularia collo-cygni]CZT14690.1 related to UDP-N-acetyl-D-mannosamine 6-dehydrogenase [Ramularia collo-cygni]
MVTSHARPGSTIVIESSVSVGMTRTLLHPFSNKFHCGMSPERVDPGRTQPPARDIPKIISALSAPALISINRIYSQAFATVVPVPSPEVAEMTKLFENCYRMVNCAFVNEVADACVAKGIDIDEVVAAAATKPFGFQSFKPGLGVGGHCIPINPFYLMANNELPLLRCATDATWARPRVAAKKFLATSEVLPRVLVIGVGFKPGEKVVDCSPGVAFAEELKSLGCEEVAFYDPLVEQDRVPGVRKLENDAYDAESVDAAFDRVVVCIKQDQVDWTVVKRLNVDKVTWF